jgi:hypothetical protein
MAYGRLKNDGGRALKQLASLCQRLGFVARGDLDTVRKMQLRVSANLITAFCLTFQEFIVRVLIRKLIKLARVE